MQRISKHLRWEFLEPGLRESIADTDVLIAPRFRFDAAQAPRLRWVQFDSAGIDDVLEDVRDRPSLRITNASGVYATLIGEYTVASLLRVASDGVRSHPWRQERRWPTDPGERAELRQVPLRGRTAVIVGYGGVGREIARLLHAFGVRIHAVKARPNERNHRAFCVPGTGDPEGVIPSTIVGPVQLEAVVRDADMIILSAPLTPDTTLVIGERVLAAAKAGVVVVNVGRGGLIDEEALRDELDRGHVAWAILDVLTDEPPPVDHPFWSHPQVELTPHISGGGSARGGDLFASLVEQNVKRFVDGAALLNEVDVGRGY